VLLPARQLSEYAEIRAADRTIAALASNGLSRSDHHLAIAQGKIQQNHDPQEVVTAHVRRPEHRSRFLDRSHALFFVLGRTSYPKTASHFWELLSKPCAAPASSSGSPRDTGKSPPTYPNVDVSTTHSGWAVWRWN